MKNLAVAVLGLTCACAITPKPAETARTTAIAPALYTLNEGDKIQNIMPLPNKTQISVNWQNVEGKPNPVEGFRGWDLDHDGRFDMLEVLDEAGNTNMWAFDFDGDGVIDAVESGKQEPSKVPMPTAQAANAQTVDAPFSDAHFDAAQPKTLLVEPAPTREASAEDIKPIAH